MPSPRYSDSFVAFRNFLGGLRPTGPAGFEGLICAALSRFLGVVLTLSESGEQYGIDMSGGSYVAQAKRYGRSALNKTALIGELVVAARRRPPPQIWVLGTIAKAGEQLASALESHAAEAGIEVAILDWATTSRLLAVLVDQADATREWLRRHHLAQTPIFEAVLAEIDPNDPDHRLALDDVRRQLSGVALIPSLKQTLDAAYSAAFADASGRLSKAIFGQVMALDDPKGGAIERTELLDRIEKALASEIGRSNGIAVLGDEGVGKSWAIVDFWRRRARGRMLVFVPSSLAARHSESDDRWTLLVSAVRQVTETVPDCDPRLRDQAFLRRLLARLTDAKTADDRRPLIVLDGLNERPSVHWTGIVHRQTRHFGTLVITCRPRSWRSLAGGALSIDLALEEVGIPLFSDRELEAALTARGLDHRTFALETMGDIRNPRLFGIAASIGMLGTERLSRERVFWEYWRHTGGRRAGTVLEPLEFNHFLIAQVEDVRVSREADYRLRDRRSAPIAALLDRCGLAGDERVRDELQEIVTSGFFEEDPSQTVGGHTLSEGRIYYVIGLSLYAELNSQSRCPLDDGDQGSALARSIQTRMDAINALDETAASIATALLLSALDGPSAEPATRALAEYLLELRNARNEGDGLRYRHLFVEAASANASPFIELADNVVGPDVWLAEALRAVHVTASPGRNAVRRAIDGWWEKNGRFDELIDRIIAGCDLTPYSRRLQDDLARDSSSDVARPWIVYADEVSPRTAAEIAFGARPETADAGRPLGGETGTLGETTEDGVSDGQASTGVGGWNFHAFLEQWRDLTGLNAADWTQATALPHDWQEILPPSLFTDLDRSAARALPWFFHESVSRGNPEGHFRFVQIVANFLLSLPAVDRTQYLESIMVEDGEVLDFEKRYTPGYVTLPGRAFEKVLRDKLENIVAFDEALPWFEWFFAPDLRIEDCTAVRLADLALDQEQEIELRRGVIRLLIRHTSDVAADHILDRGWSAADERSDKFAVTTSSLLAMACRNRGIYSTVRDRIVGGELAALLEVVHADDMSQVIEDLFKSLEIACRLHSTVTIRRRRAIASGRLPKRKDAGEFEPFDTLRTPSVAAMERLAHYAPGVAESWFSQLMTKSWPANGDIQAFAVMLTVAIGTEAPERAAVPVMRILDHLIDLSIENDERTAIGIRELTTFFSLPFHRDVAREMERLVRVCHSDEKLAFVADRASRDPQWRRWLEGFCASEAKNDRPARRARARMLCALAGFTSDEVEHQPIPRATRELARLIEAERARAEAAVVEWTTAPPDRRAEIELRIFEAATGQVLNLPDLTEFGEIGGLLAARITAHQEAMIRRRTGTLFGCPLPPVHVVLSNVPPRAAPAGT